MYYYDRLVTSKKQDFCLIDETKMCSLCGNEWAKFLLISTCDNGIILRNELCSDCCQKLSQDRNAFKIGIYRKNPPDVYEESVDYKNFISELERSNCENK